MSVFVRRVVIAAVALVIACIGFGVWIMERSPVSMRAWGEIAAGTPSAEVERLLGAPSAVLDGGRTWQYSSSWCWSIAYVHFDDGANVIAKAYDR